MALCSVKRQFLVFVFPVPFILFGIFLWVIFTKEGRLQPRHTQLNEPTPTIAFVTLLASPKYVPGTLVLGHTLAKFHPSLPRVVLATQDLGTAQSDALRALGWDLQRVDPLELPADFPFERDERRVRATFTKVQLWNMTRWHKVIFLDSDAMLAKDVARLVSLDLGSKRLAANPVRNKYINSGVMVLRPDTATHAALHTAFHAGQFKPHDDQGLLNAYFADGEKVILGADYNARQHWEAWVRRAHIVHFVGPYPKPWLRERAHLENAEDTKAYRAAHARWWAAWDDLCAAHGRAHDLDSLLVQARDANG